MIEWFSKNGLARNAKQVLMWGVYIAGREHNLKLKFSMLTCRTYINTILEYYHSSVTIDL